MHGLYLLWWVQEKQLPPAFVATMMAAGDLAVMALEVPTGWIADRVGHRASLIAGSILQVCGMLAWALETVLSAAGVAIAVAMRDAPGGAAAEEDRQRERMSWSRLTARIAAVVFPAALLGALASAASFLTQTQGGVTAAGATLFVAVVTLAEAAGTAAAARARDGRFAVRLATGAGVVMFGAGWMNPGWLPLAGAWRRRQL